MPTPIFHIFSSCSFSPFLENILRRNLFEFEGVSKDLQTMTIQNALHFKLPTIKETTNAYKDKAFQTASGRVNRELARICYMITSIKGQKGLTPVEVKLKLTNLLSPADYMVLKERIDDLCDYGLRAGGTAQCPKCGDKSAAFVALVDDRYFRPTLGNLRQWKHDRSTGAGKDVSASKTATV